MIKVLPPPAQPLSQEQQSLDVVAVLEEYKKKKKNMKTRAYDLVHPRGLYEDSKTYFSNGTIIMD